MMDKNFLCRKLNRATKIVDASSQRIAQALAKASDKKQTFALLALDVL
jgi:hypothetical protein